MRCGHYALELGLTWREDASNQQPEFRRNFIRLDLLPRLKEAFHDRVEQGLANLAYLVQAEEDFWGIEANRVLAGLAWVLPDTGDGGGLLLESPRLMALHLAARRRVLRLAIEKVKGDLKKVDSVHVDAILKLCETEEGHDRVQVPGIDALRSFDRLRLTTPGRSRPDASLCGGSRLVINTLHCRFKRVRLNFAAQIRPPEFVLNSRKK